MLEEKRNHENYSLTRAVGAGLAGATALTLAHEGLRHYRSDAPRMHIVGQRAISSLWRRAGKRPPRGKRLYWTSFVADLLSNTAYYSGFLLGRPRHPFVRETMAGLGAGLGALVLPPLLRLGLPPRAYRRKNRLMTIGLYVLGGIVTAAAFRRRRAT